MGGHAVGSDDSLVYGNLQLDEPTKLLAIRQRQRVFHWLIPMWAVTLVLGYPEVEFPDTLHDRDISVQPSSGSTWELQRHPTKQPIGDVIRKASMRALELDVSGVNIDIT